MNLERCFEIFKIGPEATERGHPDRFERNPRVKQKVETQLKEIDQVRTRSL